MKGRYKAFLRNTSGKNEFGHYKINLPQDVWKEMQWKINDNLQIDTIKNGMNHSIIITKKEKE